MVEEHFRKQRRLKPQDVKVLSLFFIDRLENDAGDVPAAREAGTVDGLYPGQPSRVRRHAVLRVASTVGTRYTECPRDGC